MRKFILIILGAFVFLISCKNTNRKYLDKYSAMQDTIRTHLATYSIIDTVFLNYRFDMDENEANKHTYALTKKGKLTRDDKGYYYNFLIDGQNYKGYIFYKFFEKRLETLGIQVEPGLWGARILATDIATKYMNKYLPYDGAIPTRTFSWENSISNASEYFFIKSNLMISVYPNIEDKVIINYSDTRVDQLKKQKEENQLEDL